MGKLGAIWKPTDVIVPVQMSKEKITAPSLSPTMALIYGVWSTTVTRTCTSSYTPRCGVIRDNLNNEEEDEEEEDDEEKATKGPSRITNYLKGKGYWDYVEGANEAHPVIPDTGASVEQVKSLKDWHQGSAKVMYWLSVNVSKDSIVGHIQDVDSPQDAWDNLISFNATNTSARKIQLKNELNTIKKGDLSVNDYTLKIQTLCESLSSIGVIVDDDDKKEACLRGLGNAYKQFKASIRTRENIPHFLELSSLLLVVEKKSLIDDEVIQTGRNSSKHALY
ncbi:hypothetical protein L7F22_010290 [Adiantum nelumboides]|nr:hypothetical protein [Adiantum nelumboides]